MGGGGATSGGTYNVTSPSQMPTNKKPGKPNAKYNLWKNGMLKQSRYTDANGRPKLDIDFMHGGPGHSFPHEHPWIDGERE